MGAGSASAATSGSRARLSPSNPRANAAICRTSGSISDESSATSGGTPPPSPTWPMASAARRRMRASSSRSIAVRSGGGGGGTTTTGAFRPRDGAVVAGGTCGAGSRSTR